MTTEGGIQYKWININIIATIIGIRYIYCSYHFVFFFKLHVLTTVSFIISKQALLSSVTNLVPKNATAYPAALIELGTTDGG